MTASATATFYAPRDAYLAQFQITATFEDLALRDSNTLARLVVQFVEDIVRADERIAELGEQIIRRIESVNTRLANRSHVNNLGELQSVPAEYDRACAVRESTIDALMHVAAAYRKAAA
jgi:hypothetical protein